SAQPSDQRRAALARAFRNRRTTVGLRTRAIARLLDFLPKSHQRAPPASIYYRRDFRAALRNRRLRWQNGRIHGLPAGTNAAPDLRHVPQHISATTAILG